MERSDKGNTKIIIIKRKEQGNRKEMDMRRGKWYGNIQKSNKSRNNRAIKIVCNGMERNTKPLKKGGKGDDTEGMDIDRKE